MCRASVTVACNSSQSQMLGGERLIFIVQPLSYCSSTRQVWAAVSQGGLFWPLHTSVGVGAVSQEGIFGLNVLVLVLRKVSQIDHKPRSPSIFVFRAIASRWNR